MSGNVHHQIIIVGGGTAGIMVASRLMRGWGRKPDIAIIEPSDQHFYQPLWTLVGGGVARKEVTRRTERSVIPRGVTWIRDGVAAFMPGQSPPAVTTPMCRG